MKKVLLAVVNIALLAACQPKGYNITGTIEGAEDGKVVLSCIREGRPQSVDTAEFVGGKFAFKGSVDAPELYLAFYEGNQVPVAFFVENTDIVINAKLDNMQKAEVTGSDLTNLLNKFNDELPGMERSQEIRQEYMQAQMSQDSEKMQVLGEEMNSIMTDQIAYLEKFIGENTTNALGALMLLNASSSIDMEKFKEYASTIKTNMGEHPYVKEIQTMLDSIDKFEQQKAEAEAQAAPDSLAVVAEPEMAQE